MIEYKKIAFDMAEFEIIADLSIPLHFDGPQPNAYGVEPAVAEACEYGDLVGDTRRGGSCNFESITLIPHCNGTHTECVGHITRERIAVRDCLQDVIGPALLLSVEPVKANQTGESYAIGLGASDLLITRGSLESATKALTNVWATDTALIIRTLPNDDNKLSLQYGAEISPFFSTEAMRFIVTSGIKHLLVDLPSIDRLYDEGKLLNHRIFWNVEPGSFETNSNTRVNSTITELIYVPNHVEDGGYLLNIQIAPFVSDAAPSRPVLLKSEPPA